MRNRQRHDDRRLTTLPIWDEHSHGHGHQHGSVKNLRLAFFLNFAFTIFEFIGGYLTNSVAIVSDAMHDLGDSLSLGVAWYIEKISHIEANGGFTYRYRRMPLFAALLNTVVLLVGH